MSSVTYDLTLAADPTQAFTFKAGMFLNRLQRRFRFRIIVEIARLLFLGFYEDFVEYGDLLETAEAGSKNATDFEAVWRRRLRAARDIERLIATFESMQGASYQGRDLVEYVIGSERLEHLRAFVVATRLDERAETAIAQAKRQFLRTFATRKLSNAQRTAFVEKYRALSAR
jgi:hypothetical protein